MDEVLTGHGSETTQEGITPEGFAQGSVAIGSALGGCQGGLEGGGGCGGGFGERVPGATRAELLTADDWGFVVGGIIAQLMRDAEIRLGEAKECIEWYQRAYDREVTRIKALEEMRDRAMQVFETEN